MKIDWSLEWFTQNSSVFSNTAKGSDLSASSLNQGVSKILPAPLSIHKTSPSHSKYSLGSWVFEGSDWKSSGQLGRIDGFCTGKIINGETSKASRGVGHIYRPRCSTVFGWSWASMSSGNMINLVPTLWGLKENASWADITFYDEGLYSSEAVQIQNKLG